MKRVFAVIFFAGAIVISPLSPWVAGEDQAMESRFKSLPSSSEETSTLSLEDVRKIKEIESLWDEGKRKAAHLKVRSWMKKASNSQLPWVVAGYLWFNEAKYKKAIAMSDRALAKFPRSPNAYYWKGRSLEAMGRMLEAANEYKAALLVDTSFSEAQEALNRVQDKLSSTSSFQLNQL